MEIETSLIRLDEAVQGGKTLLAGSKVILPTCGEAEIYGFIAITGEIFGDIIDMSPLGECRVFSNRVIYGFGERIYTFPIFRSVCKAIEEKYGLFLLYVPKFFHLSSTWNRRAYLESMRNVKPQSQVSKIDGVRIENNVAYYYPKEYELYFESRSKLRAIGADFVVITRRISMPSENIKYEVFDPHSVRIERDENSRV